MLKHLIGAIDQSTTSTKFQVFDTTGKLIVKVMKEHRQITPHAGWLEHDPLEILTNLREVILETSHSLKTKDVSLLTYLSIIVVTWPPLGLQINEKQLSHGKSQPVNRL
jgi:glycerol kinase